MKKKIGGYLANFLDKLHGRSCMLYISIIMFGEKWKFLNHVEGDAVKLEFNFNGFFSVIYYDWEPFMLETVQTPLCVCVCVCV